MSSLLNNLSFPVTHKQGWPWNVETSANVYSPENNWPKISIVTPSLNQGGFIEETIRSILLQNYPNLEYIIIDGGSTDESISIIKKYEQWITYWVSEKDNGQSNAINKGISKCTGKIFNWLNSDDVYTAEALADVGKAFMNNASLAVSGNENHFGDGMEPYNYYGTSLKPTIAETIEFCEISQPSTFIALAAVKKVGGVSEDLHCIMDGEMWIKILLLYGQNSFVKLNKVLVNFRFHKTSKTVINFQDNSFLKERSSIIASLQHFTRVPVEIIEFYNDHVYGKTKVVDLERSWTFNNKIISPRELRLYFIKKYVMKQFINRNFTTAYNGIKELILNKAFDFYLLKACIKLLLKT